MWKFRLFGWQKYRIFIIAFLALGLCHCAGREHELVLLHTNDSHGSILPVDSLGGMAERATFIRLMREQYRDVLLVDAGDLNTGQAISNMFDARPDIEAYNYMGYDAVTAGNHEFDKPVSILLQQMQWAKFPFVISNIDYQGKALGDRLLIKDIAGIKMGLFGLTTKNTEKISVNAREVFFRDEVETAREMVMALKAQQVDVIIGLVHLGFNESLPGFITSCKLAEQVEGIDILVDGHSHSYIGEPVKIKNTWIVTANQSGRFVGKGILKVKQGQLVDFDWMPIRIKGFSSDTVLLHRLEPYIGAANKDLLTVIGEAKDEFPLFENGENMGRYTETALGDLVADALKWKADDLGLGVDFALTNSGGIRDGLAAGKITKGEILSILPFANELEVVTMKGEDVCGLFDFIASVIPGNGAFAQVSREVKVIYDRSAKKVRNLTIDGKPIDPKRIYHMATCDYVAAGKDGYSVGLKHILGQEKTSRLLSDVLMDYIRAKEVIAPHIDGRIQVIQ